jgi:anti-sigma factor RsiW
MSRRPGGDDLHADVDKPLEPERQAKIATRLEDHPDAARRVAAYSAQCKPRSSFV